MREHNWIIILEGYSEFFIQVYYIFRENTRPAIGPWQARRYRKEQPSHHGDLVPLLEGVE